MPKILETSKQCETCGKTFHPTRTDALYCRHACKRASERKRAAKLLPAPSSTARFAPVAPIRSDGKISLAELRANPALNPRLAAWDALDTHCVEAWDLAKKLGRDDLAKIAADAQELAGNALLKLDEFYDALS